MDGLLTGHNAHRSSSDRLLNNYLDSQKHLTTALLSLLSHSHTSTSSLTAYVTSSPGVLLSIRRGVRHAAFEGPISSTHEHGVHDPMAVANSPGWAAYVSSLEDFRRDLKQIHVLEEEIGRVKRDREILVTRLIKTTKSRPTKSDIKAMADTLAPPGHSRDGGSIISSQSSIFSHGSDHSVSGRESKRAGKLAEAQAELLGCEEHLRTLEVRIEQERNKVMYRGLEERFRAMEAVGHMWMTQARRGLADLDKLPDLPNNAFELDSNGSVAPSQSASQVGYDPDAPHFATTTSSRRSTTKHALGLRVPDSLNGSIAEEDEGSSDDEPQGTLVMHTNRPTMATNAAAPDGTAGSRPSPKLRTAPLSPQQVVKQTSPRRTTSDVGHIAPYSPTNRTTTLRRTVSNNRIHDANVRDDDHSDTSSVYTSTGKKRSGFFSSIARFFKGPKHQPNRSGRVSPVKGAWQTRTDSNIKRSSTVGGRGLRRRSDSSSDDDTPANLVAVSNINREFGGWSVADVGRESTTRPRVKRSASTKSKSTVMSQSTVTARRPFSPTLPLASALPSVVSRSNTVKTSKSTVSAGTRTPGTRTPGTRTPKASVVGASGEKTRMNGSIARSKSTRSTKSAANPMLAPSQPPPPAMPDVPKAPSSQFNPRLELAKAPGSSIIPAAPTTHTSQMMAIASLPRRHDDELRPSDSISRSNSTRTAKSSKSAKSEPAITKRRSLMQKDLDKPLRIMEERRPVSPLPPSKLRSPPLKSALRPTSPSPPSASAPAPVITSLYSISAPGPVELPPEPLREPESPIAPTRPQPTSRPSYTSGKSGETASIYESAAEERPSDDDADDETDDDDVTELGAYTVVDNGRNAVGTHIIAIDSPMVLDTPSASYKAPPELLPPIPAVSPVVLDDDGGAKIVRRKSVRIAEDESTAGHDDERERELARERAFADAAVASHSPTLPSPTLTQQRPVPVAVSTAAPVVPTRARDDSPPPARHHSVWDTRIGRVREDSSEDEPDPDTEEYTRARRGLLRNSGNFADALPGKGKKRESRGGGSVKSKGGLRSKSR